MWFGLAIGVLQVGWSYLQSNGASGSIGNVGQEVV